MRSKLPAVPLHAPRLHPPLGDGPRHGEGFGTQMVAVAVGWQVFAVRRQRIRSRSGRALRVPAAAPAGAAGRSARRPRLPQARPRGSDRDQRSLVALLLLGVTINGADQLWPFLVLAAGNGVAQAIGSPAGRALGPTLVAVGAAAERARAALDRLPERHRRRAGARRAPLQHRSGAHLRRRGRPACGRSDRGAPGPRAAVRADRPGAGAGDVPGRHPLHPSHPRHARRDHARPVRGAVRRCDRAAARSSRARSSTPGRSGSACCEAPPPSARCSPES